VFHAALPDIKPLVLLVEDEMVTRVIYKHYLEMLNVEIMVAENGRQALDMMKARTPHLIISDIIMPLMDGFELLKDIRFNPQLDQVVFIALTARPDQVTSEKLFALGANDFVVKKSAPDDFLARVGRYVI
jgi:chemosensory pili system protein ChpA (sensor histidine kinase/response regulator)